MQTLAIDIETFSSTDLAKSGVYKYAEAADFEILLFAYAFGDNPVHIIDLKQGEVLPSAVLHALTDPRFLKKAHNANFERTCIAKHFHITLCPSQWSCTMAKASMLGLPLSLEMVGKVLKLEQQKSTAGKALIRYFSLPCKPTKANGERTRNLPGHDMEKWEAYKEYCVQDVVSEMAISDKISFFKITDTEIKLWQLDQKINDCGILIDPVLVNSAIALDHLNKERLTAEAIDLTSLTNPNSAAQLKSWLSDETGTVVTSLTKEAMPALLENTQCDTVTRVLNIRQEMSKTSVSKYLSMAKAICADNRLRGIHQYYGANRTGRWAGRLVQPQNLPKNFLPDLDLARQITRRGDMDMLTLLFGNVPDTLSQLIRTSFIAPAGSRFIVADFSAIEARVIAWLANEKWRLDVFNTHGKIYEASASQMFRIPMENITKDLRQKGKVSELALGYQGGPNALIKMGALKMGIDEEELPKIVAMWRQANKRIVLLWKHVDEAAINTVSGEPSTIQFGIRFFMDKGMLVIMLPSGRMLFYQNAKLKPNKFGGESVTYWGMDQTTRQWCLQDTYGGKLVENIVQAIARDCLADAMLRMDATGYKIVMHVHDEIVSEVPGGFGSIEEVNKIMGAPISWAKGLPLTADSYETNYYKKD